MIVKMTILRLLGSSDDKEKMKINVARRRRGAVRIRAVFCGAGSCNGWKVPEVSGEISTCIQAGSLQMLP